MGKVERLDMETEFSAIDFNSKRLEQRFIRTMKTLSGQPEKSIWFCSENRAEAKAIYRMLGNENLDREEILRTHREAAIKRMTLQGGTVLAIQDTMCLNYNSHGKTEGIGYIGPQTLGVNIHSCLAVTADGLSLGLLDQRSYNREQAKDESLSHGGKQSRAIEEKESFRWIQSLKTSAESLPEGAKVITVCDREGDMYELIDAAESEGQLFLVRVIRNRLTVDNGKIMEEIIKNPCMGRVEVTIPRDSRRNIKERESVLQIRHDFFEIKCPQKLNKNKALKGEVGVWVIHAREEEPPKGTEPIEWFLMSNEPVETVEAAYERVCYYVYVQGPINGIEGFSIERVIRRNLPLSPQ
jgi:hypothetical protein